MDNVSADASRARSDQFLGIDIGGTGIKARLVHAGTGELVSDRIRRKTPVISEPGAVADIVAEIVNEIGWDGPIGTTFPGVISHGRIVRTAVNLDPGWVNLDIVELFSTVLPNAAVALNDADAAAIAEARFGAARGQGGVAVVTTFGTGIGSGLLVDGMLVPNTELGHIQIDGQSGEAQAAAVAKDRDGLTFPEWGARVNRYLNQLHALLWPELIVLGGGVSKHWDRYASQFAVPCPVVPAELRNEAGIVGAAMRAAEMATAPAPIASADNR